MKTLKLAQEVLEVLWRYDLDGSYIYVPMRKSPTLVGDFTPKVLLEIEATYEERGVTFYWEASPRKVLSGMFGKRMVASMFNLKLRTAASVVSAAYQTWREWFSRSERHRLDQLRRLAETSGCDYTALFLSYLEIRQGLRQGQEVRIGYYTDYHAVAEAVIQQLIDMARVSIKSCPWRSS